MWLWLIGGIFLCYLGVKTFLTKPAQKAAKVKSYGLFGAYVSTFFLTLTNPLTILSFATIFAGLDIASKDDSYVAAGVLVLGVFLGSALWWLFLCSGINWFRTYFNLSGLKWVNRIAGVIIMAFGLIVLFSPLGAGKSETNDNVTIHALTWVVLQKLVEDRKLPRKGINTKLRFKP